ncbi:MAG TPA: hypothetical protein DDW52_01135 [Planctomycetaceae bacterium]|nr:hypothetical protein [Planctomycetaceae bacterium]
MAKLAAGIAKSPSLSTLSALFMTIRRTSRLPATQTPFGGPSSRLSACLSQKTLFHPLDGTSFECAPQKPEQLKLGFGSPGRLRLDFGLSFVVKP